MACLSMRDSKNDDWNLVQEFSAVPDNVRHLHETHMLNVVLPFLFLCVGISCN